MVKDSSNNQNECTSVSDIKYLVQNQLNICWSTHFVWRFWQCL